jgi:hypothetical protein
VPSTMDPPATMMVIRVTQVCGSRFAIASLLVFVEMSLLPTDL